MGDLTQPWQPKSCFEGLVFAASEAEWKAYQTLSCQEIIEAGGGRAVIFESGKADCTHILTRHQEEASYHWGHMARKTLVSPLWLWESYEADEQLALQDPIYHPFPARAIPGASGFQVTITGITVCFAFHPHSGLHVGHLDHHLRPPSFHPWLHTHCQKVKQGTLRVYMLDLLACMGVQVCKAMPPQTITHVVASNLHDKTSKKLEHARNVQAQRRLCIINCLWIFDCLRAWRLLSEDDYINNIHPGQDPMRGARVSASYVDAVSSLGGTVQDSEDEDEPVQQQGGGHSTPAAHTQDPGMLITPVTEVPSSGRTGAQAAQWRSRKTGNASRSRLGGAAGATEPRAAPGAAQKENQHPSSAAPSLLRSGDTLREGPASSLKYGSESQMAPEQVARAQAVAGRLAAQLAPSETELHHAVADLANDMADDEQQSPAHADGAQSGKRPSAGTAAQEQGATEGVPPTRHGQPGRAAQKQKAAPAPEQPAKKRKLLSRKAATAPSLAQQRSPADQAAPAAGRAAEAATLQRSNPPKGKKAAQGKAQPPVQAAECPSEPSHTPQAGPHQASAVANPGPTPGTGSRPGSAKRVFIALSGLHTRETVQYKRLLQGLKIGHTSGLEKHVWEERVTHVVAPSLKRVAKVLAAMAAGAWVVSTEFLAASHAARALVDPDDYELEENDADMVDQGTPYHWRMRAHALGSGAFHALKVHILGKFKGGEKPNRAEVESILKAGGARFVESAEAASADLVIVHPSLARDNAEVQPLVRAKVCCISPAYIVEWLAKPKSDLSQFLLYKTKPGLALSKMAAERHLRLDAAQSAPSRDC